MRIGILLRHMGQHGGGVLVYTRKLLRQMLDLDSSHEFVLIYSDPRLIGSHADRARVREVATRAPSKLLWDQVAVPPLVRREGIDVLFNPKYSIPLSVRCRTVFVCHGLDWYVNPRWSRWFDRLNHRFLIPRYARKADRIIAVSDTVRHELERFLRIPPDRVDTVRLGVSEEFRRPVSVECRSKTRRTHRLPERFFLYCGQIYPPKNFGRLLRAYARVGPEMGISLVVAGEHRWLCEGELALIDRLGLGSWIHRVGWVGQEQLPAFYAMAEALLMPSLYEACPSPPLEAMACGCAVLASNRHGAKEIVGEAALLVDPENLDGIIDGMRRIANDQELRRRLIQAGHERQSGFTWKTCAEKTLQALEKAGRAT